MPNSDYACRRSLRAVVDAGSIPAASIAWGPAVEAGPRGVALRALREASSLTTIGPMETNVGRLIFYPLAIGLFLLVDTALRATGH